MQQDHAKLHKMKAQIPQSAEEKCPRIPQNIYEKSIEKNMPKACQAS